MPNSVRFLDLVKLHLQRFLGRFFVVPMGYIILAFAIFKFHYKIENHSEVRKRFKETLKRKKPLLVCSNHLTYVDSVILMWGLSSILGYFFHYRTFCWNIPAVENYASKPLWQFITYLSKCIPIDRQGTKEHKDEVLNKLRYLLSIGDICMIFPEGTRSRSGMIEPENVTYGVGKILEQVPECEVLCIYMRGRGQDTYSSFPKKDEQFYFQMELLAPKTTETGRRAVRDYSVQVINKLKSMEDIYFASISKGNERFPSSHSG